MADLFIFPKKSLFGPGAIRELPTQLGLLKITRPLLVTDSGLVKAGLAGKLGRILREAGLEGPLFDGVEANPREENVLDGLAVYEEEVCDGIIGFGGGSAIDVAKAVRLKANHPLPLIEYALINQGAAKITQPLPPLVAIPTTAGTGSEVARGALIIVRPTGNKVAIAGEEMYPSLTICDPELTLNLPPFLTAGTGMDAFTHCIEEYLSPKFNPFVEGMVLEGIRRTSRSLLRCYENGDDLEARRDMMIAAMIGGIGFVKGLGVVHSLSHPVGSLVGGHHGTTNAIFLPASLEFNFEEGMRKWRPLLHAAGGDVAHLNDEACGREFIRLIRELNRKLRIPKDLSAMGARRAQIDELVPLCMADHCHLTNPRPCAEEDFRKLLELHIP